MGDDNFDWGDNLVAPFNYFLRQALCSSEEIDNFDVRSEDPASLQKWQELTQQYIADAKKLIDVVLQDPNELRRQLDRLLDL